jgi:hypothetical protein
MRRRGNSKMATRSTRKTMANWKMMNCCWN